MSRFLQIETLNKLMKKIYIINGPNLNLLGKREPSIYGNQTFEMYLAELKQKYPNCFVEYFQSNIEGELIDKLHEVGFSADGIILNPGGYSHSSVAIADAIAAITTPVVEVHISNVHAREEFRQQLITAKSALGTITGFGLLGYEMALKYFTENL